MLLCLSLFVPLLSRAQTITVKNSSGGTVPSHGTVYINPGSSSDFPMPELNISFTGVPANATIEVYITTHWLDSYDTQENGNCSHYSTTDWATCLTTPTQTVYADCNGNASATFDGFFDWGTTADVGSEGANDNDAEIHWSVNGTAQTGFDFNIGGDNVPGNVSEAGLGESVDQFYQGEGAPWFWGYMLYWESTGGRQYATSPGGPPLVVNDLDGIGVAQVDGRKNPNLVDDYLYWNIESNILTGLGDVLAPLQSGAYVFWNSQVQQMCQWLSGTYSSGTCSKVQQPGQGAPPGGPSLPAGDVYPPQSLPNCSSRFTLTAGQVSGWEDSEWIKAYNGAPSYYIIWDKSSNLYQFWYFSPGSNNYVYHICNSASY